VLDFHFRRLLVMAAWPVINALVNNFVNFPGWCRTEIQHLTLIGSSSSVHSEACNTLGASDESSITEFPLRRPACEFPPTQPR
jgi:hypothetical protein